MSSGRPPRKPLIALVDRANRALQADMVREAHARGRTDIKPAHNVVFGTLTGAGGRTAEMAARAGITRQSMGEIVRDLVDLGIVEMTPDPDDRRAKVVRYTEEGRAFAEAGMRYIASLEQRFAEELGEAEYATARDVLARVVDVLERVAADDVRSPDERDAATG